MTCFDSMNLPYQLPLVTVDDFSDVPNALTHTRLQSDDDELSAWIGWSADHSHQYHHHHHHQQQTDSGVDDENDDDNEDDNDDENGKVVLPPRYCRLTTSTSREFSVERKNELFGNTTTCDSNSNILSRDRKSVDESYSTMECRERDLHMALKWIKQEMIYMKRQNKSLLKQFTDLRAGILQFRYSSGVTHGSLSDLSSVDGSSTTSLNENGSATPLNRLTVGHDYIGLSAGKKSVSLPSSPMVSRSRRAFGIGRVVSGWGEIV